MLLAVMIGASARAVQAQGARVAGTVREQGGRPLAGVVVQIATDAGGSVASDTTGADGIFLIAAPTAVPLALSARRVGFELVTLVISPLANVER
ncbi:MAG: carboxypeptidase-like regulatory domain-containing protein, partial [Gemmatimonas sp.]